MALDVVATFLLQQFELAIRLDALGDDFETEAMRHVDDRIDDCSVVRVNREIANEGLVDLQCADWKLL